MMQVLADHDISWLQNIKIRRESKWFENNRGGCMDSLLVLLARQTGLKTLMMRINQLSDARKDQIRTVVT